MWINRPAYTVLLAGEDIANWKGTAMKFDVKLKKTIGNREVSDSEWENHLVKELEAKAIEVTRRRVASITCPEHGQAPVVTPSEDGLLIEGCCDKGIEAARQALKN